MAALTATVVRAFPATTFDRFFTYKVKGTTKIYEGGALGEDTNGYVRPLAGASSDAFRGFAERDADNSAGADGDISVRARTGGHVKLVISGTTIADIGKPVFAQSDNDFVLTRTADDAHVGYIRDVESGGNCIIEFLVKEPQAKIADAGATYTSSEQGKINAIIDALEMAGIIFPS